MKKTRMLSVTVFLLSFLLTGSMTWADTYISQVESVYWINQGGVQLYHFQSDPWPGSDGFDGSAGSVISPPYMIGQIETPLPVLTGTDALEMSTLPYLASYDVTMPNYVSPTATTSLPIYDADFIVNFKVPPESGLAYNVSIMEETGVSDLVILTLVTECSPDGTITYALKLTDETGQLAFVSILDFSSIAMRITVDSFGGATAYYSLNPVGDITDPTLVPWQSLPVGSDLDSESQTGYGAFFNISASCSPPLCAQGFPAPNVDMSIKKMKINLKNGKFEIKGYLDVNDPDFSQLVNDPQAGTGLLLQTGGTSEEPQFGIFAGEQIQLKTKWKKLEYKSRRDDDDDDDD